MRSFMYDLAFAADYCAQPEFGQVGAGVGLGDCLHLNNAGSVLRPPG